jgi:predicted ATP-dependent endonuclease of OLD family
MRLTEVEISGYKRLASKQTMDLDGHLVCIVGPNGAGKSSFLDALVHLTDTKEFLREEMTRAEHGNTLSPVLQAVYVLEAGDRKALSAIPEAADATTWTVTKTDADGLRYGVHPYPRRRVDLRERARKRLDDFLGSKWLETAAPMENELDPPIERTTTDLAEQALAVVSSESQTLTEEQTTTVVAMRDRLRDIRDGEHLAEAGDLAEKYAKFPEELDRLIERETATHPLQAAVNVLYHRQPLFVKFERDVRELEPQYDLTGEADLAVESLLALAGKTWDEAVRVMEAGQAGDPGSKIVFLEEANEALGREFSRAWGQTPLTVKLDIDANLLKIMMSMQARDYIRIDQHSDGLRQFVALRAFIAAQDSDRDLVVLIDEAETHLHYDAQADLVGVFENQEEAAAIIYTTHSAGCLPRDLGIGLRGIVPIYRTTENGPEMTDHSEVVNGFWFNKKGFSPLLIAMGASAFAFSAAQKAVVTEGFTDALLLPTLLREACNVSRLEYQLVPDFARSRLEDVIGFDLLAARVAFVADGDQGGADHVENSLKPGGVLDEQIVFLGGRDSGTTLEDLIAEDVFVSVIKQLIGDSSGEAELTGEVLGKTGRMNSVAEWCENQSIPGGVITPPEKSEVAKALLARRKDGLLAPEHRATLTTLDSQLRVILDKATARLAESPTGDGNPGK